jgi:hypothetical protein
LVPRQNVRFVPKGDKLHRIKMARHSIALSAQKERWRNFDSKRSDLLGEAHVAEVY